MLRSISALARAGEAQGLLPSVISSWQHQQQAWVSSSKEAGAQAVPAATSKPVMLKEFQVRSHKLWCRCRAVCVGGAAGNGRRNHPLRFAPMWRNAVPTGGSCCCCCCSVLLHNFASRLRCRIIYAAAAAAAACDT